MSRLFDPLQLGAIEVPNRILMAPLTRARASRDHVPVPLMAQYYAQRASAGLIISEATGINQQGLGWPFVPGIWNSAQIEGWKAVTAAVHAEGGRIFSQLWHMGRLVHPSFNNGATPVSASATTAPDQAYTYEGKQPYVEARPLELAEIPVLLEDYKRAAANALAAGFDGVQIHAANGYLIDQFLRDGSNFRTDAYGGPIENRIRLLREVTEAVASVAGADRTSVRLSPNGEIQGVNDSNPVALFTAAAKALSELDIAFLELREPPRGGTFGNPDVDPIAPFIREVFSGPLVLNSDYDQSRAEADIASGLADAVSFGRPFISNPDLPRRFAEEIALHSESDMSRWYQQGAEGYTDYAAAA